MLFNYWSNTHIKSNHTIFETLYSQYQYTWVIQHMSHRYACACLRSENRIINRKLEFHETLCPARPKCGWWYNTKSLLTIRDLFSVLLHTLFLFMILEQFGHNFWILSCSYYVVFSIKFQYVKAGVEKYWLTGNIFRSVKCMFIL